MTQRFQQLMALAVDTEDDIRQMPAGVWRRFCPSCRGEFLPHLQTCPKCVERISEVLNTFNAAVKELMEQKPDIATPEQAQETLIWGLLNDLSKARTEGNKKQARELERRFRLLKAFQTKQDFDAQLAEALAGVENPEERTRITQKMRALMSEKVQKQLDMAVGKLAEPVEVAPTYARKLQDYVHRSRETGKPVTTTYAAAKFLGFGDKDSFITFAISKGIHPVMTLDTPGGAPHGMPEPKPGGTEQVRRMPPRIFHYAAWNVKDLLNLRKILKKQHERAEMEPQISALRQEISTLENRIRQVRIRLAQIDDIERAHPEKISEVHKLRQQATGELDALEKKLAEKRQQFEAIQPPTS